MAPRSNTLTIQALVRGSAEHNPNGIALAAPGRQPLAYRQLLVQIAAVSETLHALGAGRGLRIATLLRSGPETAVLSLAAMSQATLAPINPDLTAAELE